MSHMSAAVTTRLLVGLLSTDLQFAGCGLTHRHARTHTHTQTDFSNAILESLVLSIQCRGFCCLSYVILNLRVSFFCSFLWEIVEIKKEVQANHLEVHCSGADLNNCRQYVMVMGQQTKGNSSDVSVCVCKCVCVKGAALLGFLQLPAWTVLKPCLCIQPL